MMGTKKAKGFTLIELIIVILLVTILYSIGCFSFHQFMARYRLEGAVRSLVSDFYLARMKAIGKNCFYRLRINPEGKEYFLEQESLGNTSPWPGNREGVLRKFDDPKNPYYFPGVELVSSSHDPIFLPRGTVVGTTILLRNDYAQKTIILSSQGRVKIR
ncbi:MAG: prepilin-type N-terminal cleavage/methylation domain-containing protein [Thermodesulfobacteriota bacterium]